MWLAIFATGFLSAKSSAQAKPVVIFQPFPSCYAVRLMALQQCSRNSLFSLLGTLFPLMSAFQITERFKEPSLSLFLDVVRNTDSPGTFILAPARTLSFNLTCAAISPEAGKGRGHGSAGKVPLPWKVRWRQSASWNPMQPRPFPWKPYHLGY